MLEGLTSGFILSLALFPGTVWMVKVGRAADRARVFAVGAGLVLSQIAWLAVGVPGLMMMLRYLNFLESPMYYFGAFILLYHGWKLWRTRRASTLDDAGALPPAGILFHNAFTRATAMPMRLPSAIAVLLATGLYVNNPVSAETVALALAGAVVGVCWWWGQVAVLTVLFANRVPEQVTLRSLNKIRPLCAVLFLLLTGICLVFAGG